MSQHLQGGKVNIALIQEKAREELLRLLEKCEGSKALIWDEQLSGPVGLIAKYTLLRDHGVVKMFPLKPNALQPIDVKNIIFITRPHLNLMDIIAEIIQSAEQKGKRSGGGKEFHLILVPNLSLICEKHLKNRGVYGSLKSIERYHCVLFPIDNDVMSMEIPDSFRDYHLDEVPSCLYLSAQALMTIQQLYGPIGQIWGKGNAAKTVWDLAKRLKLEAGNRLNTIPPCIDQLLLIDRAIDLISPLATQLTYEGLIDEIFGIRNCTAHFPVDRFVSMDDSETDVNASDKKQIILNSADELYAELRDKNFNAVGPTLSKQAKSISVQFDEWHGDKSIQKTKQFVARLPNMMASKKVLSTHTTIAECIKDVTDTVLFADTLQTEQEFLKCIDTDKISPFIEELLAEKASLVKVLRLICLQCATGSGLKPKLLEFYKRELVQVYGLQTLVTINKLERAGLLYAQTATRSYTVLRKSLHLTMEDTSETEPTDISYVHCVYAPLSVRLAENLCKPRGWKQLQDVLGLLPGPSIDESQPTTGLARRGSYSSELSNQFDSPKVILVFFIGGCTFAEISALRFLSQQEDNVEFVVVTTKLINGNSFIDSFIEHV